jgi:LacI family transcriptional regulator
VSRNKGYIAPETKLKVLTAINRLRYHPNYLAQRLRSGRSYFIGFVLNDISNPFISHAANGAEQFLQKRKNNQFEILFSNTGNDPQREIKALKLMISRQAEAIILASTASNEVIEYLQQIVSAFHIPIISLDNQLNGLEIGVVTVENQVGSYLLTNHLIKHGHNDIGFICGPLRESHVQERINGCRQALQEVGLDFNNEHIAYGNWMIEDGYQITNSWLMHGKRPTAIFSLNNFMCMGALTALIENGIRVPDDIALVSFDDIEFGNLLRPRLTALEYSSYDIGSEAMRLALAGIKSKNNPNNHRIVRLPVRMLLRESCGCTYI